MSKQSRYHCRACSKKITVKQGIAHYQKFHSDLPESCFIQFGETWDKTLTRVIAVAAEIRTQYDQCLAKLNDTIRQLEAENKTRLTLTTKLNGIIMILQSKQEG